MMRKATARSCPPLEQRYADILQQYPSWVEEPNEEQRCDLPLIDLQLLRSPNSSEREQGAQQILQACSEWGFFQAINHGVPPNLTEQVHSQAKKLFSLPFELKKNAVHKLFPYAWGSPIGLDLKNSNWMENFHIASHSLNSQSFPSLDGIQDIDHTILSVTMAEYGRAMGEIGCQVLGALASQMGLDPRYFSDCYSGGDSFIRLNRYPPCTRPEAVYGIEPHTDSDLLTIIHQDQVGGLQIFKDNKWINVKPRVDALVINIGDLMQAWSNDMCKSALHRVAVSCREERVSLGYFVLPFGDTFILSPHDSGRRYRGFTIKDFRAQILEDIKLTGSKIGLSHFRL